MVERLLGAKTRADRETFYEEKWDTLRWRLLFKLFFSRLVLGRIGRDPSFFDQVEGRVAHRLLERSRHALTVLDPSENPYLQMILTEESGSLPFAYREENFATIREHLDAVEVRCESLEVFLASQPAGSFDAFNLSDLFEYLPQDAYEALLREVVRTGRPGARVAYWNLFVARRRPEFMSDQLCSLIPLSRELYARDKAFFYSDFVVEQVLC